MGLFNKKKKSPSQQQQKPVTTTTTATSNLNYTNTRTPASIQKPIATTTSNQSTQHNIVSNVVTPISTSSSSSSSYGGTTPFVRSSTTTGSSTSQQKNKLKWTPIRRVLSTMSSPRYDQQQQQQQPLTSTLATSQINATSLTKTVVRGSDDGQIEVMTLESQQVLEQREMIRKKLFDQNNIDSDYDYDSNSITPPRHMNRSSTDVSQEVLPNGYIYDTNAAQYLYQQQQENRTSKLSDRFSIPIQQVTRSCDTLGSLVHITEEPVDYGTSSKSRSTLSTSNNNNTAIGPISVDLSYTESELASVMSKQLEHDNNIINQRRQIGTVQEGEYEDDDDVESRIFNVTSNDSTIPPNTPDSSGGSSTNIASSPGVSTTAGVTLSPANTTTSSQPMDEQLDDIELRMKLNTGKSPLRGMPMDEQYEYQKDEMIHNQPTTSATPKSSNNNNNNNNSSENYYNLSNIVPFRFMNQQSATATDLQYTLQKDAIDSGIATTADSSIASATSVQASQQSSMSQFIPEAGRTMLEKMYECSTNALSSTGLALTGTKDAVAAGGGISSGMVCTDPVVDMASSRGKVSVDETASLTTLGTSYQRPVYLDEEALVRFIRRITYNGFVLLYLQPPSDEDVIEDNEETNNSSIDDWKGRTVTIIIQKGQFSSKSSSSNTADTLEGNENISPKLEWTTVTGGNTTEATTISIDLLNIQSISINDDEDADDNDDLCFFTITSEYGDVHVFETASIDERDRIVNGLRTLIARWSFHVIAGDVTATAELFDITNNNEDGKVAAGNVNVSYEDIPSLPNPHRTMNYVAHRLLDCEI